MKKIKVVKNTSSQSYGELYLAYVNLKNMAHQVNPFVAYELRLSALVMLCFSVEAFANHIGESFFEPWDKKTRHMSPINKLKLLHKELSMAIDYKGQTFIAIESIMTWRNAVAHARSKTWKSEYIVEKGQEKKKQWDAENIDWKQFVVDSDLELLGKHFSAVMHPIHMAAFNGNNDGYLVATRESSDTEELD